MSQRGALVVFEILFALGASSGLVLAEGLPSAAVGSGPSKDVGSTTSLSGANDSSSAAPASIAAGASSAPAPAQTQTPIPNPEEAGAAIEEALALRDPFMKPAALMAPAPTGPVSDLERYPVDQFKLIGVITGASRLRAILVNPEGKTFFVSERMKIGTRRGVIREIRANSVLVREKIVNVIGKEEPMDSEIRLPDENTMTVGSSR
ncbi:MAG: type pilus assembly protein PilP [Pseudomonadota bacterium]|jgi:Tfp pilus assembly protein PilP